MLSLTKVAELDVSAASGLVALADRLCVVADDERFLASYGFDGRPLGKVALWPGSLPEAHAERKRHKPDLEALTSLPDGRLLALGSGSTSQRHKGALVDPARNWAVREIDAGGLYRALACELPELNLEGAVVLGDRLWLAHRGNGKAGVNACVELDLGTVVLGLDRDGALDPAALRAIHRVELGDVDGVALGLTDLAAAPDLGLLFSATAEDSADTYADGPCTGSVIGLLSERGLVRGMTRVDLPCKIEGLATAAGAGPGLGLWLVADPDDRSQPAPLLRAELSLGASELLAP